MNALRRPLTDRTLPALAEGYAWLPDRLRASDGPVVATRLLGRPALAVRGSEAVRLFHDEGRVRRHDALPGPVLHTLFGRGAVPPSTGTPTAPARHCSCRCSNPRRSRASPRRPPRPGTRLSAPGAHAPAWCCSTWPVWSSPAASARWAGMPLAEDAAEPLARDLPALVDGFAALGPRR
ncbi:hypothetical protein [Streptomyces sp. NPDC090994]|uniref:hypothetical protein n=1 Tax=Streptomyces sp. NPDC090994 TaxID=3365969 RepID=UPI00380BD0DF